MKIVARVFGQGRPAILPQAFFRKGIVQSVEERIAQPDAVHGSTYGLAADRS